MSEPLTTDPSRTLEPVHANAAAEGEGRWTERLILFLRVMAALSMLKGLYHWSFVLGVMTGGESFEARPVPWQTATVFFAIIDLVAAVGLWLAAAWGAVVWLTAVVSMAAVEALFPQIYGGGLWIVTIEGLLLAGYLLLAVKAARERPP
jgi:hypothetical protein